MKTEIMVFLMVWFFVAMAVLFMAANVWINIFWRGGTIKVYHLLPMLVAFPAFVFVWIVNRVVDLSTVEVRRGRANGRDSL